MQREIGGEDRRLVSAQRRRPIRRQHKRSWHPTRGPTSTPVLIVATTTNAIGRAGRPLQTQKKPIRAGASPARLEQQRHGGRRERGQRWATPAAVRRSRDDLPHTRHDERRCGRGRGSSSPARKSVTRVDRQGVAAGDCSPITASASRLAERRPSVGEVALSYLVLSGTESCSRRASATTGRAPLTAPRRRRSPDCSRAAPSSRLMDLDQVGRQRSPPLNFEIMRTRQCEVGAGSRSWSKAGSKRII